MGWAVSPTLLHPRERRHRKATGCASQTRCPRGCAVGAVSPLGVLVPAVPSESPPPRRGTGLCRRSAAALVCSGGPCTPSGSLNPGLRLRWTCAQRGREVPRPEPCWPAGCSAVLRPPARSIQRRDRWLLVLAVLPTLRARGARAHPWGPGPWGSPSAFRQTRALFSGALRAPPSSASGPEFGSRSGLCRNTCPWAGRANCGLGAVQEAAGLEPWGLRSAGLLGCCLGSSRKGGRGRGPRVCRPLGWQVSRRRKIGAARQDGGLRPRLGDGREMGDVENAAPGVSSRGPAGAQGELRWEWRPGAYVVARGTWAGFGGRKLGGSGRVHARGLPAPQGSGVGGHSWWSMCSQEAGTRVRDQSCCIPILPHTR